MLCHLRGFCTLHYIFEELVKQLLSAP